MVGMTSQEALMERARSDTTVRWWGIAVVLTLVILVNQNRSFGEFWPVLTVVALGVVYNFILSVFAHHQHLPRWWPFAEIGLDLVMIAGLAHFTGGILLSPLYFLFPLLIFIQAFHRNPLESAFAVGGLLSAFFFLFLLEPAVWTQVRGVFFDRLLVLAGVGGATLVFTLRFNRELTQVRTAMQEKVLELDEAVQINEKLHSKIQTSTQKLEDANVMLVKKNLAMMALHEIYLAMNSTFNSNRLLNLVLDTAMSLLKANTGCMLLVDAVDKNLRVKESRGLDHKRARALLIRPGIGFEGQVVQTGKEEMIGDLARYPEVEPLSPDTRSKMCAPLRIKNKVVGAISIESSRVNAFTKSDLELLTTMGSQASEVLQNVELYEEMRNKADGLSLLFEISQDISAIFNLKRLLATVLERAMQVMKARRGSLMIFDKEHDQLVIRASAGMTPASKLVRLDSGIAGWVFRNSKPVILPSVESSPLYDRENDQAYVGKNLIASPLSMHQKVFGVICLNDREGRSFSRDDLKLLSALASQAAIAIENVELYANLRRDYLNAIKALAAAVDAKDHYTHGHSNKVMTYSALIARELKLSNKDVEKIKYGALLHDIGKIGISEAVLNKPAKLTPKEFDTIAMHPILGVSIVQNIESLKELIPIILYHHERYSGGGYPEGISGNGIPLGARIVGVADSWDVMTSDRAYRKALPLDVALAELKKCSGTQFDPEVVQALLDALAHKETIEPVTIEEERPDFTLEEDEISRLMD
jgi:putative nucleotidyltransferase with HDIG domain